MKKKNSNSNIFSQKSIKQIQITSFFKKKIYGYNHLENTWHCCECGVDMGSSNPRQFCGKYQCNDK